jgi:hypothetical protein
MAEINADIVGARVCRLHVASRAGGPSLAGLLNREDKVMITIALTLCAVRFVMAAYCGFIDDEAYYRLWSLAPALSYFDHPPVIAWIIGAGRALVGDTSLGVRLLAPPILLLGTAALWRTAQLLYGPETARRATWFMLAMPLLAIGGIIVTPDLPSVLFSVLVLWALAEFDRSQNDNWWLAVGLFAGLGLISKYTNLFLGATILIWLAAVAGNRKSFTAPQFWVGGLIAAAITTPVIIWNGEHGWASFAKQFGRVTSGNSGHAIYHIFELIGSFLGLASPLIAVIAIAGLAHISRSAFVDRKSPDVLLAATVLPILIYFFVHCLHDRVQGNWLAPIYPAMAICAAVGVERLAPKSLRRVVVGASGLGFVVTSIIFVHALFPFRAASVLKDPTMQMHGWSIFSDAIEKKCRETGAVWIATASYGTTGQLAFGLRSRRAVAQIDERIRYTFLPPLPPSILKGPALFVDLENHAASWLPQLRTKFEKITPLGILSRHDGSESGVKYGLYLLSNPSQAPF